MTPSDGARLDDIDAALRAIREHLTRGPLDEGLVFDAVRVRLIEIGESVKRLSPDLLKHEPEIPWTQIAAMRNRLAHRYFDTSHAVLRRSTTTCRNWSKWYAVWPSMPPRRRRHFSGGPT